MCTTCAAAALLFRTQSFLGADSQFIVDSCAGHVRDLPPSASHVPAAMKKEKWSTLGVNVANDFEPLYVMLPGKKAIIDRYIYI
jgi:DNA topoisomerase I